MKTKEKSETNKEKVKKFLSSIGIFLAKGFAIGRWEVKFTWRF